MDIETRLEAIEEQLDFLRSVEDIRDVLYRYARACDRSDIELLKTCYHEDGWDNHGQFSGNGHKFAEYICAKLAEVPHNRHFIGNPIIELDGDRAFVECRYVVSQRVGVSDDSYVDRVIEGRYLDIFERRNGVWAISYRDLVSDGGAGNRAVLVSGHGDGWSDGYGKPGVVPRSDDPMYLRYDIAKSASQPTADPDPWGPVRVAAAAGGPIPIGGGRRFPKAP